MFKPNFYKELKSYFDNSEECLIFLNDDSIYTQCRILNLNKWTGKLQFTCESNFIDRSFGRCELIISLKDVKYVGRQLQDFNVEDDDFCDDDDNEDDWEESLS